jgi:hypothetical protein
MHMNIIKSPENIRQQIQKYDNGCIILDPPGGSKIPMKLRADARNRENRFDLYPTASLIPLSPHISRCFLISNVAPMKQTENEMESESYWKMKSITWQPPILFQHSRLPNKVIKKGISRQTSHIHIGSLSDLFFFQHASCRRMW